MLKSVLCDLTPLDLCSSGFSPWSISSSAEVLLTSCVSKSCVPIRLLSYQKTPGHPSPPGELLLSQCLPCSLPGNPAAPMGASSSVTNLSGADLVWFARQLAGCVLMESVPMGAFWLPGLWPECPVHSRCPGRALGCSPELEPGCNSRQTQLNHTAGIGILLRAMEFVP